jgi:hypothetical protein
MNSMKRSFELLLAVLAIALFVNRTNGQGRADAATADHSYVADLRETTQTRSARAMSAGPKDVAKSARIVDIYAHVNILVLREENNGFPQRQSGDRRNTPGLSRNTRMSTMSPMSP